MDRFGKFWCITLYGPCYLELVLFLLLTLPKIIIDPQYSPLQTLKCQDVLMTELQFIAYVMGDGILYHFSE